MGRPPQNETQLQNDMAAFMRRVQDHFPLHFHHIPNGGKRSKRQAATMKHMGVQAGVADFCLIYGGEVAFAEVKFGDGKLSDEQIKFGLMCQENGLKFHLWRSVQDCSETLYKMGIK